MENLAIQGSESLPSVMMQANGHIKIEGRAFPENAHDFFQPIIAWTKEFSGHEAIIEFNLEYFNTSVSKYLHQFMKSFDQKKCCKKIEVIWHFEEGDDDMLEAGEIFEELFPHIQFTFKQFEEALD